MTPPDMTTTVTTHEDEEYFPWSSYEEYLPWSSLLAPFSARSVRATYVVRASSGTTPSLQSGATGIVIGFTFTNPQDPRSLGTTWQPLRRGWLIDKFVRYPDEASLVTTAVNVNVDNVAFVDPLLQLEKYEVTVRHLERRLHTMFEDSREEILESGFESALSRSLSSELIHHGLAFVEALSQALSTVDRQDTEPAVASLHLMGRVNHPLSHDARFNLLVRALRSPFAMIRDGAGVGLALLNDARAIPSLGVAISQEQVEDLRRDLSQVLDQLERSLDGGVTS